MPSKPRTTAGAKPPKEEGSKPARATLQTNKKLNVPKNVTLEAVHALSAFDQMFVDEYLIDCNVTAAARRAGATSNSASKVGQAAWMNPAVRKAIQLKLDERASRMRITQDRVVQELQALAFSNVVDYVEFSEGVVTIKPSRTLDREHTAAVKSVRSFVCNKEGDMSTEIVLHDKMHALKMLGNHLGMFQKGPSTVNNTLNVNTQERNYAQMSSSSLMKLAEKVLGSGKVAIEVSAEAGDGDGE